MTPGLMVGVATFVYNTFPTTHRAAPPPRYKTPGHLQATYQSITDLAHVPTLNMSYSKTGLLVIAAVICLARGGLVDNTISGGGWSSSDCLGRAEPLGCLASRAVLLLDRASRSAQIDLVPGLVSLTGEPSRAPRTLASAEEIEASLPEQASERSSKVLDMVYQAAVNFLKGRSLQIQLPEEAPETLDRAIEEGEFRTSVSGPCRVVSCWISKTFHKCFLKWRAENHRSLIKYYPLKRNSCASFFFCPFAVSIRNCIFSFEFFMKTKKRNIMGVRDTMS